MNDGDVEGDESEQPKNVEGIIKIVIMTRIQIRKLNMHTRIS